MAHSDREVHIVIAAYCEDAPVGETVRGLLKRDSNVIVVDDGSPDRTAAEAVEAGATVRRHGVNRGQGAAFHTGIAHVLRMGARYIVTLNADGQHAVADIPLLLEPLKAGPCDVVLGSRLLGSAQSPTPRRLVLKAGVIFTPDTADAPGKRHSLPSVERDVTAGFVGLSRRSATRLLLTSPLAYRKGE